MDHLMTPPVASASASASMGVKSRDEWKTPRTIRVACDRCHSQKLRCVRKQGEGAVSGGCERCLKLHTQCRFGPRAPRGSSLLRRLQHAGDSDGSPKGGWHAEQQLPSVSGTVPITTSNPRSNPAITDSSSSSNSEWLSSLDVDAGITEGEGQVATMHPDPCYYPIQHGDFVDMHTSWPDLFPCEPGNLSLLDQYGSLDVINEDRFRDDTFLPLNTSDDYSSLSSDNNQLAASPSSAIRDLANLNIALFDCAAKLPSTSEVGVENTGLLSYERSTRKRRLFAIDELFQLTSEFIDVPSFTHVDDGTMLLIMSCHCRLTEIYLSIFQMMQACIEYSVRPQKEKDWAIILPRLQMGSYNAPTTQVDANTSLSSATSSMYMVMITMLSSQLCEKVADMMRTYDDNKISPSREGIYTQGLRVGRGSESHVSPSRHLFISAITERTDRLRSTINATKHLLQHVSLGVD